MYGRFCTEFPVSLEQSDATDAVICLYANAVRVLQTDNSWQSFSAQYSSARVLACSSAATRRDMNLQPRAGVQWTSLPDMYLALAAANRVPRLSVRVHLHAGADQPLALSEALDALLGALALDWQVELVISSIAALRALEKKSDPTNAAKGYASLPLFGLTEATLAPGLMLTSDLLLTTRPTDCLDARTPKTCLQLDF